MKGSAILSAFPMPFVFLNGMFSRLNAFEINTSPIRAIIIEILLWAGMFMPYNTPRTPVFTSIISFCVISLPTSKQDFARPIKIFSFFAAFRRKISHLIEETQRMRCILNRNTDRSRENLIRNIKISNGFNPLSPQEYKLSKPCYFSKLQIKWSPSSTINIIVHPSRTSEVGLWVLGRH